MSSQYYGMECSQPHSAGYIPRVQPIVVMAPYPTSQELVVLTSPRAHEESTFHMLPLDIQTGVLISNDLAVNSS